MWSFTHLHMLCLHKIYRVIQALYINVVVINIYIFLVEFCVHVYRCTNTHVHNEKGAITMRTLGIIGLVVIALVFLNVISLHTIGTLSLIIGFLIALLIGAYFLYYIVLSFLALFTTIVGIILVICLISYAFLI